MPAEACRRSTRCREGSRSACQDLSSAGKGAGLDGARSGLWFEFLRLIDEARPRAVLIENVATLTSRGLDVVVSGLAGAGYGCWWDVLPALAVGAPHLRQRVWITAVPYDSMPELDGEPFREVRVKMPRAGASTSRGLIEMTPSATVKACKAAMGASKREDGVTWLESIDSPLFPTPSASSYGSNRGGAAGRVGQIRHSLESMARHDEWPRVWPTASQRDWKDVGDGRMGRGQLPEAVRAEGRLWPTLHGLSNPNGPRSAGPSGNVLGNEVNKETRIEEQRLWATPRKSDAERGGRGDLIQQVRGNKSDSSHGEQRIFPTPRSRDWKGPELSPNGHHTTIDSLPAVARMWPTPEHSDGTGGRVSKELGGTRPSGARRAITLATAVNHDSRLWPTPSAAMASQGPGRQGRDGGPNLRTAVADEKPGPLSPDWTEWLLGLPVGWTDLSIEDPVQFDWLSEYDIPRVKRNVDDRKQRLSACGNSLVWHVAYVWMMRMHDLLGVELGS